MSGSGPFTEDWRRPPPPDPRVRWRAALDRHANGADGRCAVCGHEDCDRGQWAGELLAEEDQRAAIRAAGQDENDARDQNWWTSEGVEKAAEPPEGRVSPWDASHAAESRP
jgi:hypothetical protein